MQNFKTWYRWQDVANLITSIIVVNGRNGVAYQGDKEIEKELLGGVEKLEFADNDLEKISASKIRETCKFWSTDLQGYLEEVDMYDRGGVSLKDLVWV